MTSQNHLVGQVWFQKVRWQRILLFPADNFSLFWADLSQVTDSARAGSQSACCLYLSFTVRKGGGNPLTEFLLKNPEEPLTSPFP